jgi:hypothetical protein
MSWDALAAFPPAEGHVVGADGTCYVRLAESVFDSDAAAIAGRGKAASFNEQQCFSVRRHEKERTTN